MRLILLLAFLFFAHFGFARQKAPILERTITITFSNEKTTSVLNQISQLGNFSFAYNSSIISDTETITFSFINKTVREVLNEIFKGSISYKEKNNHLILTRAPVKKPTASTTVVVISGYVEDAATKERVADASVYDKKSITSVVTDEHGHFKMKLDQKDQTASIAISKKDYKDTLVTITAPGNQYLNISIAPLTKDSVIITAATSLPDSVREEKKPEEKLTLPYQDEPNVQNISDTLYRKAQISLVPFVGTNGPLSGNVINDYSFNVFAGYSMGTHQIEVGGLFNIDRGDVRWLQIAGIGNLVGGNVYGIQASGYFNVNGGTTTAIQATSFGNVNFKDFTGIQASGFANVNLQSVHGVSVAGFANITKSYSKGVQVAGVANIQGDNYSGSQFAGLTNIATRRIDGSQVAAFFNYGKKVRGTQIGVFNYADSLGGVPIGVLSIVKHGYHKIEVSGDEVFYTNVAFRTGVQQFYNFLLAGMQPKPYDKANTVWTFGYGLGTAPRLAKWLDLNIDLSSQQVNKGGFTKELSVLNKIYVGLDFHIVKKLSIYTGVTLNGYLTKATFTDYPVLFTDYQPHIFYDHTFNNNTNMKLWVGGKLGIRIL